MIWPRFRRRNDLGPYFESTRNARPLSDIQRGSWLWGPEKQTS
jgi:hypothetical protein